MRKLIVLGVLLTMTTGCGRGWFPHLFRGAPCNGLCSAPAAPHDCDGCAGYSAGYEGEVQVDGGYVGTGIPGGYETVPPTTMNPLTNPPIIQGTK